jgi:hypothetical protein
MPNTGPHATLFATEFTPTFSGFFDAHAMLRDCLWKMYWFRKIKCD